MKSTNNLFPKIDKDSFNSDYVYIHGRPYTGAEEGRQAALALMQRKKNFQVTYRLKTQLS